jgi:hypothetical protein
MIVEIRRHDYLLDACYTLVYTPLMLRISASPTLVYALLLRTTSLSSRAILPSLALRVFGGEFLQAACQFYVSYSSCEVRS